MTEMFQQKKNSPGSNVKTVRHKKLL